MGYKEFLDHVFTPVVKVLQSVVAKFPTTEAFRLNIFFDALALGAYFMTLSKVTLPPEFALAWIFMFVLVLLIFMWCVQTSLDRPRKRRRRQRG